MLLLLVLGRFDALVRGWCARNIFQRTPCHAKRCFGDGLVIDGFFVIVW